MNNEKKPSPQEEKPIDQQAREQTGQSQVRLRIDERNMRTSYANAFRTGETAEEIIMDFGLNSTRPSTEQQGQPEIVFSANERIIMNYYSAKRLALTLGQIIQRYEQQFGPLEMDVSKRRLEQGK